jgi:uncharacterized membrane protein
MRPNTRFPGFDFSKQRLRLLFVFQLASVFIVLLLLGRNYFYGFSGLRIGLFFLIWNLSLAWVPFLAALRLEFVEQRKKGWLPILVWLCIWLAFLPNAPYIITDLVHLKQRAPVPFWYDLVLFYTTASTGLALGLVSIRIVQELIARRFNPAAGWLSVLAATGLSGFGVWMGRFLRWNSWDIIADPVGLLRDVLHTLSHKAGLVQAIGVSGLLAGVLLVGYAMLWVLQEEKP